MCNAFLREVAAAAFWPVGERGGQRRSEWWLYMVGGGCGGWLYMVGGGCERRLYMVGGGGGAWWVQNISNLCWKVTPCISLPLFTKSLVSAGFKV